MDRFSELLWDLSEQIDLPLHVDKHRACRLLLEDKLAVQMELDSSEEFLQIATLIAEVPPGKYRENLLVDGLKANHKMKNGALGYIEKSNSLTLSDTLFLKEVKGEALAGHLEAFIAKALLWKEAIESGGPSPVETTQSDKPSPLDLK